MLDLHMKCDNCKSENIRILYSLSYMDINECKECGLRFTDQSKIPKSLYTENYFKKTNKHFFEDSWADYETKIKTSKKLRRFKDTLKKLEKYTNKGNLLDVGCATGVFLDIAKKKGWKPYGVEISKFASEYGRKNFNLNIQTGDLLNARFKENFFDLVTMWDVIEHVEIPSKTLIMLNKIIKKGGVLFLLTTNDDSLMGHLAHTFYKLKIKKFAELIHPKHHNYHFTKKVLINMLNKSGFEIVYTKKSEMPLENIIQGQVVKAMATVLYLFSGILRQQHEIIVIARKK